MHIVKVGLNYRTAPVEVREKLTFSEQSLPEAMVELKERKSILENVIISTCNRTEVYAVVDQLHTGRYYIKQFLADWFGVKKEEFSSYLHISEDDGAIEHLFRVTVGLDSMVVGETQILGQVKHSFMVAQQAKVTGTMFNELFKQAITFAKRTQKETAIGTQAVSVSYAAVELARKIFGKLQHKHVAILGAGEMGELAVKNLQGSGADHITVVNRSTEKAEKLAGKFDAEVASLRDLPSVVEKADILITSTGAASYMLTPELIGPSMKKRKGNPFFIVDIAVPRDADPAISRLDDVFLYDIDDLQHIVDENMAARQAVAEEIEIQLEGEIVAFKEWVQTLGVVPVITALRKKALSIQAETMNSIERKMPDLTDRERKVLSKHTKSIINQLLKEPVTQAKELAGEENAEESLDLFVRVFGLQDEVKEELIKQAGENDAYSALDKSGRLSFSLMHKLAGM
ncbi:glutamyl-tRNA reductase [Virgibacillus xinjiangensis]|uniref:Glutamyl-tRNA reductase n=1 Tax=Virgibacillus xinjiangensis TaxID=393090 RepID=A0ABV7CUW2_9BACI